MTEAEDGSGTALLYTRPDCPLCFAMHRTAARAARRHRIPLRLVDISDDPILTERFGLEIPVLMLPDGQTFRGRADSKSLEAAFRRVTRRNAGAVAWLRRLFGLAGRVRPEG